jgi:membrane-bound metal-dependent hydrolase YbcI (DUF457 family)
MPFTPAHVAAVLPVLGRRRPRWAVPSALVIGSMVPDVLYFVPISSHREFSHSLTGVLTLDLALGLLLVGLWRIVATPVVRDLVPLRVRARIPVPQRLTPHEWRWAGPGVVIGSLTHVFWDAFTHSDGWAVRHLHGLTDPFMGGLPAFKVAQYGSGVVGVVLVLGYGLRALAEASPDHDETPLATTQERAVAWQVLLVVPVVCGLGFVVGAMATGVGTEMLLYVAVVRGVSGLGLALTAVAVWWHLRVRPRGPGPAAVGAGAPADRAADRTR